jgi:hypothetical protein
MELMRTIPDTIDLIKKKMIRILDCYYSIIESVGIRMSQYGWQKRWCDRKKGTGYKK